MEVAEFIIFLICLILMGTLLVVTVVIYITPNSDPKRKKFKGEESYYDPLKDSREAFPSILEPAKLTLSVVIPAYNEEQRLPKMLSECTAYLEERTKSERGFTYEIILADDGSKDSTTQVGLGWTKKLGPDRFRVLTLIENRGKGGAVTEGVMRARGEQILFADADGATKFLDLEKLEASLIKMGGEGVVCGSRSHLEKESIADRSLLRTILMLGFHMLVYTFGVKSVKDTQCGFKLFSRRVARLCFSSLHIQRWAFDVEILKIAEMLSLPISEVAVNWKEIDGSKLDPASASIQMGKDIMLLWLRYKLRLWRVVEETQEKKNL